jgi:hypothetical protein
LLRRTNTVQRPESGARVCRKRGDDARHGFMLLMGWRLTTLMLFLARVTSGPEVTQEKNRRGYRFTRVPGGQQRATIIRVRDFNAAAKVERAASAGRIASGDACLHYCRYSADTSASLSKNIRQKRPLRSVHETVHK